MLVTEFCSSLPEGSLVLGSENQASHLLKIPSGLSISIDEGFWCWVSARNLSIFLTE